MIFPNPTIDRQIQWALAEDTGFGDITSEALIPVGDRSRGKIWAKEEGVLAGIPVAERVFQLAGKLEFQVKARDGQKIEPGQTLAWVEGSTITLLKAERLALNFLQRLSGIATQTRQAVELTASTGARIVDTRKTTPLWRWLEKYAVRQGGGFNHRLGLYDAILIKDNHIRAVGGIEKAVKRARERAGHTLKVEVEVSSLTQLEEALAANADIIMLDNMEIAEMEQAVRLVKGRALVEASGGITLDRVAAISRTGVDLISMGSLTHSVRALDISLDLGEPKKIEKN